MLFVYNDVRGGFEWIWPVMRLQAELRH